MTGKIVLSLAMSLDGYIVDENGKFDWIVGQGDKSLDTKNQIDMSVMFDKYDVVVMGRTSFDEFGGDEIYKNKDLVVATHKKLETKDNVTFVSDSLVPYVESLKEQGKTIWLFGGSSLTDNFIKEDAVDEYEVAVVPIILGNGTKLFFDNNPRLKLHLDKYVVADGIVILNYSKR